MNLADELQALILEEALAVGERDASRRRLADLRRSVEAKRNEIKQAEASRHALERAAAAVRREQARRDARDGGMTPAPKRRRAPVTMPTRIERVAAASVRPGSRFYGDAQPRASR